MNSDETLRKFKVSTFTVYAFRAASGVLPFLWSSAKLSFIMITPATHTLIFMWPCCQLRLFTSESGAQTAHMACASAPAAFSKDI